MRGLEKKVAIVTGGGGAIGRALCRRFAEEGSVVGVFDVNDDTASETAALIEAAGGTATVQQVDITDYDAVAAPVAAICPCQFFSRKLVFLTVHPPPWIL